jgi:histone H3/H4
MEEEVGMPTSSVARIVKQQLPGGMRCSTETIKLLTECSSEFARMLCSEASEHCLKGKTNTIGGEHVLEVLGQLGFQEYVRPVTEEQTKLQEQMQRKVRLLFATRSTPF